MNCDSFSRPIPRSARVLGKIGVVDLAKFLVAFECVALAFNRDAMGEVPVGGVGRSAMLAPMEPEAIPVGMLASWACVAAASLENLHGSRCSIEPTVCSVMNSFSVSAESRVSRPTLTYAIRRALSQLRSVPGRTPKNTAACSTDNSGPGAVNLRRGSARHGDGNPLARFVLVIPSSPQALRWYVFGVIVGTSL